MTPLTTEKALTVSQLNRQVKRLLEGHFDYVWIEGELSNLARPGSGHWYFSLKDDAAQVRCAMFRNRNQRLRFAPENGQHVMARARVSLYEARGEYQLIVEHLEDAGAGALQRAFEELKARLQAEGLFAPETKQTLPRFPQHIGVITSPTGAAIRDILTVFARRFPGIAISILPVPVQGPEAAPAIAAAVGQANRCDFLEAIIVARGGGSMEDLWAFNEEIVARAIGGSNLPVVSGVGHETDFTIADFVADVRAPTPSAAAEMLSPDRQELSLALSAARASMAREMQRRIDLSGERLRALRRQMRHPGERLREQAQRLDDCELHLHRSMRLSMQQRRHALAMTAARLRHLAPQSGIERFRLQLSHLASRGETAIRQQLREGKQTVAALAGMLDTLSPLATLERGYAIVSDESGRVLTADNQVDAGDIIDTRLARGSLRSRVLPDQAE